jgi:serine protease Do
MRRTPLSILLLLALGVLTVVNFRLTEQRHVPSHDPRSLTTDTFAEIAQRVLPQTVNIYVTGVNPNLPEIPVDMLGPRHIDISPDDLRAVKASGSGVIVREDGIVVTNHHLFTNIASPEIEVHLYDGRVYGGDDVQLLASDRLTDIAVLKVRAHGLIAAQFGDSDRLNIGDWVVAVGNPLELASTVTQGIVSAKYRQTEQGVLVDFIQSSAHIDPGSSGGALLNVNGELIGINTAIATDTSRWEGFGFALPSNTVRQVVDELLEQGHVPRGFIGINFEARDDGLSPVSRRLLGYRGPDGVLVLGVQPGGPADLAGLRRQDIVLAIAGQPITTGTDLLRTVASLPIGSITEVELWRGDVRTSQGRHMTLQMAIAERPSDPELEARRPAPAPVRPAGAPEPIDFPSAGLHLEWRTQDHGALVVTEVDEGSAAETAGFQRGDVILRVNAWPILSPTSLWAALRLQPEPIRNHSFLAGRGGEALYMNLDASVLDVPPAPEITQAEASSEEVVRN